MYNKIIQLSLFHYSFCPACFFLSLFSDFVGFLFPSAFLFHQLFSLSLTLIIGIFYCLNYTSLLLHLITTLCITPFSFIYYFQYLCANDRHLLLSWLHFAITSSYYDAPCNRFYNNYTINLCPRQLLWFI